MKNRVLMDLHVKCTPFNFINPLESPSAVLEQRQLPERIPEPKATTEKPIVVRNPESDVLTGRYGRSDFLAEPLRHEFVCVEKENPIRTDLTIIEKPVPLLRERPVPAEFDDLGTKFTGNRRRGIFAAGVDNHDSLKGVQSNKA